MKTDALIEALAADTRPVDRCTVQRRLAAGLGAGALAALLPLGGLLGIRPDLHEAVLTGAFWGAAAYFLALGLVGFKFAVRLARPECSRLPWSWFGVPLVIAVAGETSIGPLDAPDRLEHVLPAWACVPLILMLALPFYAGLILTLRAFAPTRLSAAGGAAGLTAGSGSAAIYGLHSLPISLNHSLTCCTAAIGLAAVLGAIGGRRLLRW